MHGHPQSQRDRLGAVLACDVAPMGVERRAVSDGRTPIWSAWTGSPADSVPLDGVTGRALGALGYGE